MSKRLGGENLNAFGPSEHPPARGENVKTFRWDHWLQTQNLFMAFKRIPIYFETRCSSWPPQLGTKSVVPGFNNLWAFRPILGSLLDTLRYYPRATPRRGAGRSLWFRKTADREQHRFLWKINAVGNLTLNQNTGLQKASC